LIKQKFLLLFCAFFLPLGLLSQQRLILKESEGIDIIKLMEDHQLFITRIQDMDVDDDGNLCILDDRSGNVVRMDLKTGLLVNKISSLGQGPAELMMPSVARVRNNKLFVVSGGYHGIKIFSISGDFLGGFKTNAVPRWMDVDKNENIYVAEADQKSNPVISVYDAQGKKIRTAMTFQLKKEILEDKAEFVKRQFFKFKLDSEGNIIILFELLRRLKKANPEGTLLWEQEIENSVLKPFLKNEGTRYDDQGRPRIKYLVSNFDLDQENNIVIGHVGGGCIYNQKGDLISILEVQTIERKNPPGLRLLKIIGDKLLGIYADGTAFLFPYKLNQYSH
jgi:hypothetical protein